jgi:hypothetical protein
VDKTSPKERKRPLRNAVAFFVFVNIGRQLSTECWRIYYTLAVHIPVSIGDSMANQPKNKPTPPEPGDPLFNLKHAQAEAELGTNGDALAEAINEDDTADDDLDEGPRDSQGNRRGEPDAPDAGTTAGRH